MRDLAADDGDAALLRRESFNTDTAPASSGAYYSGPALGGAGGGSCWRRCLDTTIELCSVTAVVRVVFLVFLGVAVACLALISGYGSSMSVFFAIARTVHSSRH